MDSSSTIVDNLRRSVERNPEGCAVSQSGVDLSYSELWAQVMAVAGHLQGRGLACGDRVALVLKNSSAYIAAYYGALAAGGIVVALNASAKSPDLAQWIRHSGATWLFVDRDNDQSKALLDCLDPRPCTVWVGALASTPTHSLQDFDAILSAAEMPRRSAPVGRDLASILYTSGTTGRPKGVLLRHANLVSNTNAIVDYLGLSCADSSVTVLPFYYSYGNSVLNTHLTAGARISLADNLVYPQLLVQRLVDERATGFSGVSSTYSLLLSRVRLADYDLSSLRYVTQAGGSMSPTLTQRLVTALPQCRVFVMYGQTEASARLCYLPPDRLQEKMGSVGVAVQDVRIEVRHDDGRKANAGEIGEVWARGPNVMVGYWLDPVATAATLQDDWLKTGDSGYQDRDGYLYLVGRRSDIIKAGAHRIHPADVERVIAEVPGVEEVAVVGVDDEVLGQAVKAFLVASPGVSLDLMSIRAHARSQLSSYKVPKYLELVASLPKTSSGKVRRGELINMGAPKHEA